MNILLCGATGAMGQAIAKVCSNIDNANIICGIAADEMDMSFPIYKNFLDISEKVDVIIDFSVHFCIGDILEYALDKTVPVVIATTGHSDEEIALIHKASEKIAIFKSGNMSLGVSSIVKATKVLADILKEFDVEIIEKHHNKKVDAPSGTARMLVEAVKSSKPSLQEVYGREGIVGKRKIDELGVHSIRGGTIVGEHSVIFAGLDEVVEIKHTALSKAIFAKGAIGAAEFIVTKKNGMFSMDDIINN